MHDVHSFLSKSGQRITYTGNLHRNIKEIDFRIDCFEKTTHPRNNCSVLLPQLQRNGRRKRYAYSKSHVHVFNEIIKLNGVEFHGNKLIADEAKMPPRTI